jgi:putative transposase
MIVAYHVSVKRACRTLPTPRSSLYYKAHKRDEMLLAMRMREIAYARVRYGFRRIEIMLRREGFADNHKRMHRIYREQGLALRIKRPLRNRSAKHRIERFEPVRVHQVWSMDFVADQLFNGRKFRVLTIVDNFGKKCPGLFAGQSIKGSDVVNYLDTAVKREGAVPERIEVDNGSEFISKESDRWAYENKVVLDISRPGKPTDNPYIESFNGKFRDECLSVHQPRRCSRQDRRLAKRIQWLEAPLFLERSGLH